MAAAGAIVMPYILPTGRLFAASGSRMSNHVVFVLFAGGVRQQESVEQLYLDHSQGVPVGGNIMYNMLNGTAPTTKIVYGNGVDPMVGTPDSLPISQILGSTLQSQGTLFNEFEAASGGHYRGLVQMITGSAAVTQGLRQRPTAPTIFEYARKHLDLPATKVWFVGNGIGNSIPLLNYSEHADYGADYGANFFAPQTTFGPKGVEHFSDAKIYHPEEELGPMYEMKYFMDDVWGDQGGPIPGVKNTEDDKQWIKEYMRQKYASGSRYMPPVSDNGDTRTIGWALDIMAEFSPTITVINLSNVDGCHSNFTGYLKNLHRADHAVGYLWNTIQTDPLFAANGMKGNTTLMISPEHGRNELPNGIEDENDWFAFDHSDANTRRMFGMMVGPGIPANNIESPSGSATFKGSAQQCSTTIAEILGFKSEIIASGMAPATSLIDIM